MFATNPRIIACKLAYRQLLEHMTLAVAAEDHDEVARINVQCNAIINCVVAEIREARGE